MKLMAGEKVKEAQKGRLKVAIARSLGSDSFPTRNTVIWFLTHFLPTSFKNV